MANNIIESDKCNINFNNSEKKGKLNFKNNSKDDHLEKNIQKDNSMDIEDNSLEKIKNVEEIPKRYKMYKNNELINVLLIKKIPLYDYEEYILIFFLNKVFIIIFNLNNFNFYI